MGKSSQETTESSSSRALRKSDRNARASLVSPLKSQGAPNDSRGNESANDVQPSPEIGGKKRSRLFRKKDATETTNAFDAVSFNENSADNERSKVNHVIRVLSLVSIDMT